MATDTEQLSLIPDEIPTFEDMVVRLGELPPSDDPVFAGARTEDPHVAKQRRDSIERFGMLHPVLLAPADRDDGVVYRVEDGRRRILAARDLGLEAIPARVQVTTGWAPKGALGLISNEHRSENTYGQMVQVEELLQAGYSIKDVTGQLGISVQRITQFLSFRSLDDRVIAAWRDGQVKKTVVEQMIKLSDDQQARLLEVLERTGKITTADIKEAKEVKKAATTEQTQWDLDLHIEGDGVDDPDAPPVFSPESEQSLALHAAGAMFATIMPRAVEALSSKRSLASVTGGAQSVPELMHGLTTLREAWQPLEDFPMRPTIAWMDTEMQRTITQTEKSGESAELIASAALYGLAMCGLLAEAI